MVLSYEVPVEILNACSIQLLCSRFHSLFAQIHLARFPLVLHTFLIHSASAHHPIPTLSALQSLWFVLNLTAVTFVFKVLWKSTCPLPNLIFLNISHAYMFQIIKQIPILIKDNLSKAKMLFLSDDYWGEKLSKPTWLLLLNHNVTAIDHIFSNDQSHLASYVSWHLCKQDVVAGKQGKLPLLHYCTLISTGVQMKVLGIMVFLPPTSEFIPWWINPF